MNAVRHHHTARRVIPTHQGFKTDDLSGAQVDLRLVVKHKFAAINPRPQFLGDDDTLMNLHVQFGGVKPEAVPAILLRAVEREIGLHHQGFPTPFDSRSAAVVRAAINLGHSLDIEVIAEGVETKAQVDFLVAAGCEQAQGYYFSRPLTAAGVTDLLREPDDEIAAGYAIAPVGAPS
jgi:hypothetical protein